MNLADEARKFLRSTHNGMLSTFSIKFPEYPFGSVAPFILDHQAQPILLISTIAEHTKNIIHNPKVSLLVLAGAEDLQANARLTILGEAIKIDKNDTLLQARYLRYYPESAGYFEMHDFSFYRLQIEKMRYIAGFGKMGWLDAASLDSQETPLATQEAGIIEHMNTDHAHSLINYCQHFHNLSVIDAQMLGIDTDGFDVRAIDVKQQQQWLRFDFEQPVTDATSARAALVQMSKACK